MDKKEYMRNWHQSILNYSPEKVLKSVAKYERLQEQNRAELDYYRDTYIYWKGDIYV